MTRRPFATVLAVLGLALALGCRGDPGVPDYSSHAGLRVDAGAVTPLPGPDPYETGEARLAFGIFYESGFSRLVEIDDVDRFYNVFIGSFEQDKVTERVEGVESDRILLNGTPFWGGGIDWMTPVDLSGWTTMHVSFLSADPSFDEIEINILAGGQQVTVRATDFGYVNDGEWHNLEIPLSAFGDFDATSVNSPFGLGGPGGARNDVLLVDDLYWTQE